MRLVSCSQRNLKHREVSSPKVAGRSLEPQAADMLAERFSYQPTEDAVKVEDRKVRQAGQPRWIERLVEVLLHESKHATNPLEIVGSGSRLHQMTLV